jgi:hypothetical protein
MTSMTPAAEVGLLVRLSFGSRGPQRRQIESPESWRAAPETFTGAFSTIIFVLNIFTIIAVLFSAVRGNRHAD